jgi:predicted hydrocarbon binding protein
MLKQYIPNSMMYITLLTVKEIIGENGLNAILNFTGLNKYRDNFPSNDDKLEVPGGEFATIIGGIIDIFGERGARPILYKAGRRGFQVALEKNPMVMGVMGMGLKLLSKRKRLERVFAAGAEFTNKTFGENQRFYVTDEGLVCELFDCYWCRGLKSNGPICFGEVGLDAEVAKWATGDEHEVKEVLCRAKGDEVCKVVISFEPKEAEGATGD